MDTNRKKISKLIFKRLRDREAGVDQQRNLKEIFDIIKSDSKGAALCRDILTWIAETNDLVNSDNHKSFRFSELGNWLIENHKAFVQEFASSHLVKSYRLHSKRNFIQDKIEGLIRMGLIYQDGTAKAEKNDSRIPIYSSTREAVIVGQLIAAKRARGEKRRIAINSVLNSFSSFSHMNSLTEVLSIFINKCKEKEIFLNLENDRILYILISCVPEQRLFNLFRQFAFIWPEMTMIFVDSLMELNEKDRDLILFQIKLDVERDVTLFSTKEWEKMRYQNIHDLRNVTLEGFCFECDEFYQFKYDLLKFLELPDTRKLTKDQIPVLQSIDCIKCGKKNCMDLSPSWLGIWFHTPLGLVDKNLDSSLNSKS